MKRKITQLFSNGKVLLLTAVLASSFTMQSYACEMCGKDSKAQQLHTAMQKLWGDHMIWTYACLLQPNLTPSTVYADPSFRAC